MFLEQTGQCVYCGRRVHLVRPNEVKQYHIEHFRPREKYPSLELEYTNLFLSCGSNSNTGARSTCGVYKGNWFEEKCHISPCPDSCSTRFFYLASGIIHGNGSPEANKMIEMLNLNDPALIADRKAIMEELDKDLSNNVLVETLCADYQAIDGSGARPGFANVAIAYLSCDL